MTTSSSAARVLRLPPEIRDSSTIETALPASPTTPKTTIAPEATGDGSISRRIAFGQDEPADREQHRGLRRGGQHLGAPVPPGPVLGGRASGQHRGHQGQRQPGHVGEHVPGVGQQRQRPGDDRADHLDDQDRRGDAQHDRQRTAVPGAGQAVIVPVPGAALLAAAHATAARGPVPEAGHSAAATPAAASTPSAARSRSISSGRVSA